ncbi:hypothetical protein niasHT_031654 [Heterodera trifolii]|uniref:Tyrosine specific protein phosphatases domain-containing protein n=1 Tax=Heterodera trifolii TaxID=157864 RepID=A0ABD2IXX8_9BILA
MFNNHNNNNAIIIIVVSSTAKNSATINGIGTICSTAAGTTLMGPCVVHCSAVVGRPALLLTHRQFTFRCDRIDVVCLLRRMRRQYAQLVQTLAHVIFCHENTNFFAAVGLLLWDRNGGKACRTAKEPAANMGGCVTRFMPRRPDPFGTHFLLNLKKMIKTV